MNEETALEILANLRTGKIDEQIIYKEQFMKFREVLIKQEDKANFVGIAQKGGHIIYKYRNKH